MTFNKHNWNQLSESSQNELKRRQAFEQGYRDALNEQALKPAAAPPSPGVGMAKPFGKDAFVAGGAGGGDDDFDPMDSRPDGDGDEVGQEVCDAHGCWIWVDYGGPNDPRWQYHWGWDTGNTWQPPRPGDGVHHRKWPGYGYTPQPWSPTNPDGNWSPTN